MSPSLDFDPMARVFLGGAVLVIAATVYFSGRKRRR